MITGGQTPHQTTATWSNILITCLYTLHYWSIQISQLKGSKVSQIVMIEAANRARIYSIDSTLQDAEESWCTARKYTCTVVKKARVIHNIELQKTVG